MFENTLPAIVGISIFFVFLIASHHHTTKEARALEPPMEEPLFPLANDTGSDNFAEQALETKLFTKEFEELVRKMLPDHMALLNAIEQRDHPIIVQCLHNALALITCQQASDPDTADKAAAIRTLLNRCTDVMNEMPIL